MRRGVMERQNVWLHEGANKRDSISLPLECVGTGKTWVLGCLTFVQYQPMCQSSCWPLWPISPVVSMAIRTNRVPVQKLEYEVILSLSPGSTLARDTRVATNISEQVRPQVSCWLPFQTTSVATSGLPLLDNWLRSWKESLWRQWKSWCGYNGQK